MHSSGVEWTHRFYFFARVGCLAPLSYEPLTNTHAELEVGIFLGSVLKFLICCLQIVATEAEKSLSSDINGEVHI